jgi:putative SOS response-associated peptidase YedK
MCNRYANRVSYRQYVEELSETKIPLRFPLPDRAPNLEPRDNIFPTGRAPVLRPVEDGLELAEIRWGLIPWFHKNTVKEWRVLTTNARSETIATIASFKGAFERRRCLVPVSNFYEWTGEKGKKTKWSFRVEDAEWFCFAGVWDRAHTADGDIESFALVTLPPSPAFEKYHDRSPLILRRSEHATWLESPAAAKELITTPRPDNLVVEMAAV